MVRRDTFQFSSLDAALERACGRLLGSGSLFADWFGLFLHLRQPLYDHLSYSTLLE